MKAPKVTYDVSEGILFIDPAGVEAETKEDVDALFEGVIAAWRKVCRGNRVDVVVSYDGFHLNLVHNDYYAERMQAATGLLAKTVVRHGGDSLARTAARLRSIKLRLPSNLFETRLQALKAIHDARAGRPSASG